MEDDLSEMQKLQRDGEYIPGEHRLGIHIADAVQIQGKGARVPLVAPHRLVVVDRGPVYLDFPVYTQAHSPAVQGAVQTEEICGDFFHGEFHSEPGGVQNHLHVPELLAYLAGERITSGTIPPVPGCSP